MEEAKFFSKLRDHIKSKNAFVVYRFPNEENQRVHALLQNNFQSFTCSDFSESGFVFAPFSDKEKIYLIPSTEAEKIEFQHYPESKVDEDQAEVIFQEGNFPQREKDQKDHENLVQKAVDTIKNGHLKKVVLSRKETVQVHDPDPVRIYKNLLDKYSSAFAYLWFHPETGFWLGATPETLLKTERNRFKTMALAGTQLFRNQSVVKWEQKEIEEQKLVTDYILETLADNGIERIEKSDPYTLKAGNLLHICTDITGTFQKNENGIAPLINSLHPTPAVCGLPKEKAKEFILENEGYNRKFYTGFLGELNLKTQVQRSSRSRNQENQQFSAIFESTRLFVNLRCLELKGGDASLFVGGGITKDSIATSEWMETVNKAQTMKAILVK
ncbi:chorismate-binding protein [Christiangramia fulva]|nr:chorismate-binding protein [Christiangramia fulva]